MEAGKRAAGRYAADLVVDGTAVGLGTGSTVQFALERLAERIQDEGLRIEGGVPTSRSTAEEAKRLGIPLTTLDEHPRLALVFDGADEVDPQKRLIKGGGGALTREKVVAAAADEMVVIISEAKLVDRLGDDFLLPIEVLPFALRPVLAALRDLDCEPYVRTDKTGQDFLTDNANYIVDCRFAGGIEDPPRLETDLDRIPGILESGLFVGLAGRVVVGKEDGSVEVR